MDNNRVIVAIGRIEQAMSRIDRSTRAALVPAVDLAERHERLRQATSNAIADLDRFLGAGD